MSKKDFYALAGVLLLAVGLWQVYPPLVPIILGAALIRESQR